MPLLLPSPMSSPAAAIGVLGMLERFMIPTTRSGAVLTLCRPPFEKRRETDAVAVDDAVCAAGGGVRGWNFCEGREGSGGGGLGASSNILLNALRASFARHPPSSPPSSEECVEGPELSDGSCAIILALRFEWVVKLLERRVEDFGESGLWCECVWGDGSRSAPRVGVWLGVWEPPHDDDDREPLPVPLPRECVRVPIFGEPLAGCGGLWLRCTIALSIVYAFVDGSGKRVEADTTGAAPIPMPRHSLGEARSPSVEGSVISELSPVSASTYWVRARGAGVTRRARL